MTTENSERQQPIVIDRLTAQAAQAMLEQLPANSSITQNEMYDKLERFATNGLGVLQEQGVYAFILYLLANSGNETNPLAQKDGKFVIKAEQFAACTVLLHLLKLLPQLGLTINGFSDGFSVEKEQNPTALNGQKQQALNYFANNISGNLNHLLLLKTAFTQTLTYLRYGAKALKETKTETKTV